MRDCLLVWSAQCPNWSIVTSVHAPRYWHESSARVLTAARFTSKFPRQASLKPRFRERPKSNRPRQGLDSVWSHRRFVLTFSLSTPDSRRDSVPLFLKRQCNRPAGVDGAVHDGRGRGGPGACSCGRCSRSHTALYIPLAIHRTKYTGRCANNCKVHAQAHSKVRAEERRLAEQGAEVATEAEVREESALLYVVSHTKTLMLSSPYTERIHTRRDDEGRGVPLKPPATSPPAQSIATRSRITPWALGSVTVSPCMTIHPLHARCTKRFRTSLSEPTMRPNPTMRLEISGPRFGSLTGNAHLLYGGRSGNIQTHRTYPQHHASQASRRAAREARWAQEWHPTQSAVPRVSEGGDVPPASPRSSLPPLPTVSGEWKKGSTLTMTERGIAPPPSPRALAARAAADATDRGELAPPPSPGRGGPVTPPPPSE
jgi:hypothetical protein